jgi:hypothetical protein
VGRSRSSGCHCADPADLDYWLGGNAPVIVVLSRPKDDLAWWFDVRSEFGSPRRRAERTVTINRHMQRFDKTAAAAIASLGIPRDSGIFLPSPPKKERLELRWRRRCGAGPRSTNGVAHAHPTQTVGARRYVQRMTTVSARYDGLVCAIVDRDDAVLGELIPR